MSFCCQETTLRVCSFDGNNFKRRNIYCRGTGVASPAGNKSTPSKTRAASPLPLVFSSVQQLETRLIFAAVFVCRRFTKELGPHQRLPLRWLTQLQDPPGLGASREIYSTWKGKLGRNAGCVNILIHSLNGISTWPHPIVFFFWVVVY